MILPPEKPQALDGKNRETETTYQPPTPHPHQEYQAESSSSSRPIASPTFQPPANPPPPSYSDIAPPSAPTLNVPGTPSAALSFSRIPPLDVMYPSFSPMFLVANGRTLDKGFPHASPPSTLNPHPFASHDVYERDWISFLQEAQLVATLTEKQIRLSHLPILSLIPIIHELTFYGVKQILKHQNVSKVVDCIDKWNRHFFEQRKIRIVLMKGQVKVSGEKNYTSQAPSGSNLQSHDHKYEDHPPPPSAAGIGQELIGKNDDTYRLFVVPLV